MVFLPLGRAGPAVRPGGRRLAHFSGESGQQRTGPAKTILWLTLVAALGWTNVFPASTAPAASSEARAMRMLVM